MCLEKGYIPILTDIDVQGLIDLQKVLQEEFQKPVMTVAADVRNEVDADKIWAFLKTNAIRLSLVVNLVGIEIEGKFIDIPSEDVLNIVRTNILGFTSILTHCLNFRCEPMYIINFGSLAGFFPMPYKAIYASSKAYIIALTKALHRELKSDHVHLLVVCPAGVPTRQIVIDRIKRQGLYGAWSASKPEVIVATSLRLVKRGKAVYVPRLFNKWLVGISRWLPSQWTTRLIMRRWINAGKRNI